MSQRERNFNDDDMFVFKVCGNPTLLESLKTISQHQVFAELKEFCSDEIKVLFLLFLINFKFNAKTKTIFTFYLLKVKENTKKNCIFE